MDVLTGHFTISNDILVTTIYTVPVHCFLKREVLSVRR